jgi:hypothetical protein
VHLLVSVPPYMASYIEEQGKEPRDEDAEFEVEP